MIKTLKAVFITTLFLCNCNPTNAQSECEYEILFEPEFRGSRTRLRNNVVYYSNRTNGINSYNVTTNEEITLFNLPVINSSVAYVSSYLDVSNSFPVFNGSGSEELWIYQIETDSLFEIQKEANEEFCQAYCYNEHLLYQKIKVGSSINCSNSSKSVYYNMLTNEEREVGFDVDFNFKDLLIFISDANVCYYNLTSSEVKCLSPKNTSTTYYRTDNELVWVGDKNIYIYDYDKDVVDSITVNNRFLRYFDYSHWHDNDWLYLISQETAEFKGPIDIYRFNLKNKLLEQIVSLDSIQYYAPSGNDDFVMYRKLEQDYNLVGLSKAEFVLKNLTNQNTFILEEDVLFGTGKYILTEDFLFTNDGSFFDSGLKKYELDCFRQPLSQDDVIENETVQLYPNPFSDVIKLVSPKDLQLMKISLHNLEGKEISIKAINQNSEINLSNINSGLYILIVKDQDENIIIKEKIIKI